VACRIPLAAVRLRIDCRHPTDLDSRNVVSSRSLPLIPGRRPAALPLLLKKGFGLALPVEPSPFIEQH